jgi:hypothetical protein
LKKKNELIFINKKMKTFFPIFFEKYLKLTFFKKKFRKISIFGEKLFLEKKLICILKKGFLIEFLFLKKKYFKK